MDDLQTRIARAKTDNKELNTLIQDYIPFIKKEIAKVNAVGFEYDDKLSLGMLTFMNCVKQYSVSRGGFISYTSLCIRNRLLDESKKVKNKNNKIISLHTENEEDETKILEEKAALSQYSKEQETTNLQEEIAVLSERLGVYNLSFGQLPKICPKQKRSRALCAKIARFICDNELLYKEFTKSKLLPQSLLSKQFQISPKTIEKHRRYIVALVVILSGDYPGIGAYIPNFQKEGE